jgi:hypothetical protein
VRTRKSRVSADGRWQMKGVRSKLPSAQNNMASTYNFLVMKDAPMVDVQLAENVFWTYRTTSEVFPTPIQRATFTNRVQM